MKILSDLVSFETVNPPGKNYLEISKYLKDLFSEIGFSVEIIEIDDEYVRKNYIYDVNERYKRSIVLAKNDKEASIHFNGHYDVVPPGEGWITDPYKLKIIDGFAYGRGVSDMKGGIVSMYLALKDVKVPVEISLVPDEESGGIGTKYLVDTHKVSPKYVIIGEPSFPNIFIGHYGIIRGLIKVHGKQGHASIGGENAFINASKLALEIDRTYGEKVRRKGNPPLSLNLGGYVVSSSNNDGIIPGEFGFSFYRSILPGEEVREELEDNVKEIASRLNVRYTMEIKSLVPGFYQDSTLAKIGEECAIKILNKTEKIISQLRFDGVFFNKYCNSEVINIGPGEEAHVPNEKINIKNIQKVAEVYKCIINSMKMS
ncbi:succinyl-diaminopimelate desuccinylase [Acidianus manzaensis]|uniref:Succinyl-diaminopimelate desuccinylase n=1 Tax=Acidianus manzaensis TaxID=282676 RepID=A0A1W6K3T6_9CREN|nr:succinyl-diaminopimelate desuccinylase [Acidianus manzaensis]